MGPYRIVNLYNIASNRAALTQRGGKTGARWLHPRPDGAFAGEPVNLPLTPPVRRTFHSRANGGGIRSLETAKAYGAG